MKSPWLDDHSTNVEVEIGGKRRIS